MQRLLLTSSIFVCAVYLSAGMALGAEVFDSKTSPQTGGGQDYEQLEKLISDYPAMINRDLSSLEEQNRDLTQNSASKLYMIKYVEGVGKMLIPVDRALSARHLLFNRQFTKKQTHKKNNPRDILRGLAVKRGDHFF